jgi:cyanophycinase
LGEAGDVQRQDCERQPPIRRGHRSPLTIPTGRYVLHILKIQTSRYVVNRYPVGGVTAGYLALVGGDEFKSGNDDQDRVLLAHRGPGPAYVVPTAAARQRPDLAVATAQAWFKGLGLEIVGLPVLKRSDAASANHVALAEQGGLFYLTGGDPGLVVDVLRESPVWRAVASAWRQGAALAGSSAGAMALGEWTLVRKAFPGHAERRCKPALKLIPNVAVAPHFETFGHRWVDSVLEAAPAEDIVIVGIDERSAAVWDGAHWTACGPGAVTRITRADRAIYPSGSVVPLPTPRM